MSILVVAEHNNETIAASVLSTVAAAGQIGGDIHLLVIGNNSQSAASSAAAVSGVSKVLHAEGAELEHATAETLTAIILANAQGYTHILAPATTFGKNFLPRVGAKLDVQPISDVISVESADTFKRPVYAGNAIATVQSEDSIKVITVRATAFDAVEAAGGSAEVVSIDTSGLVSDKTKFKSQELTVSERPELTAANIIISGGRGMGSGENFHMLEEIADKLGAAVGASRAAVDAGFVPNDYQVGQTGKIVAPELYIAVGISGAIQHLAGMKDSKVIVAINKDEEAPIFQVADYGLVADLFKVLPELKEAL
ncbi:electron transfer flavoprotein subunit alpha/FixB family protein [Aliikangiella sp. IMCC44359]|uniref:electron transfer flavoprotein subunit alpha/FixB family protein n=1 Tax=Aliikangiella sp. IMCC44359 TaxID=3459125 RepID=UPI00403A9BB5